MGAPIGTRRVIAVEVKSAARPAAGALPAVTRKADDPVTVDPEVHNVLFENDHVRVFDGRASKGRKSPMHSHQPFVFVSLNTTRVSLTPRGGKGVIFDTYPGQVIWMDNAEHSWEILAGDIHVVGVEVKSAQRANQARQTRERASVEDYWIGARDSTIVTQTGKKVALDVLILDRIVGGKVQERWEQWDQSVMLQQLGFA